MLLAAPVALPSVEFDEIQNWPFSEDFFYIRQVRKILLRDLPQLVRFGLCTVWRYIDPSEGKSTIGFGTISLSNVHSRYTNGLSHPYIPVLSVKPGSEGKGYGQSIVDHLVAEAVIMCRNQGEKIAETLFLDVYAANQPAHRLYEKKCGFVTLNPHSPVPDPEENNEPYFIMSRRLTG